MGFNKRMLPEVGDLEKIHSESVSDVEFLNTLIGKSDAIIGSSESFKFLEKIRDKVEKERKNT